MSRYPKDVLAPGWQKAGKPTTTELPAEFGMVLEDPTSGFVGALVLVFGAGVVIGYMDASAGVATTSPYMPLWVGGLFAIVLMAVSLIAGRRWMLSVDEAVTPELLTKVRALPGVKTAMGLNF